MALCDSAFSPHCLVQIIIMLCGVFLQVIVDSIASLVRKEFDGEYAVLPCCLSTLHRNECGGIDNIEPQKKTNKTSQGR